MNFQNKIYICKRKPLVSVILTSYNHKDYIEYAIKSVLNQNIDDLELIVVDDGSNDGSIEIINRLKTTNMRILDLKVNRKFHPRNTALKYANGYFIAFQNSDDIWCEGKLQQQLDLMEKNKNISTCFTDVQIINNENEDYDDSWAKNLFTTQNRTKLQWLKWFFDNGNCLCLISAVINSTYLRKIGCFNPSLIQISDFDLWIRLAAQGDLYIIDKKLTKMRVVNGKNLSEPSKINALRSGVELIEVLERFIQNPIKGLLFDIFGFDIIKKNRNDIYVLGLLAKYCWNFTVYHKIFANKIIDNIIQSPKKRAELIEFHGISIIKEFFNQRGNIEYRNG
jgi:glycosyltransferase involved in cell wall biosynthesis